MSGREYDDVPIAIPAPTIDYATPATDDAVPTFVPEVDAAIDAGRSVRGLGRCFTSALAASLYVQQAVARRLASAAPTRCLSCGRPTLGRIEATWRHPLPRARWRDSLRFIAVPNVVTVAHACCAACADPLAKAARRARRGKHVAWFAGALAAAAWYVVAKHEQRDAGFAPTAILLAVVAATASVNATIRRRVPAPLASRVPPAARLVGWGTRSEIALPLDPANASAHDTIAIVDAPIDVANAIARVADPAAGGVDVFIGTTRAEVRDADRVELVALDYEAYAEMAEAQLRELLTDARARWPIARAAIVHRVGRVGLAEASVLIAVSCPHRAAAFEACRFLIDELKKSVAIWKKECWADGSVSWIHPGA